MALSALIPDGPDLTGLCRHKLEGIFDMHGVKTGSRADVPGFLDKLHGDRYFAMDFWALVESLEGIRDRISDEQIRRTVEECVCGWVPRGDPALAGIEESFDARAAKMGESIARAEAPVEPGLRIVEHDAMAEDAAALDIATSELYQNPPVVELGTSTASGSLGKIDQILSRLELNDHELKLLLESIESRISRLEPHVEELNAQVNRTQRPVATSTGRTIAEYSRQTADRAGRQLAATNVAVGSWGSRTFRRMDSGLEKTGQRFAAMDVAVKLWGSQVKRRAEPALARLTEARAQGRVAATKATSAAASGMMKCWAAAMDWLDRRRAMLTHVGTTLGVVACLALVIWLWGRPRGFMARATPVAASSTAPATAPAMPTAAAKPDAQNAQEPIGRGEEAPSTARASAAGSVEPPVGTGSGVQRVAAKMNVEKTASYTASPWIKWYAEDGTEQATAAAALGTKAAAPAGEPVPPARRQTR
jgi:hypothetical protein